MNDDRSIHEKALAILKSAGYPALGRLECRVSDRTVELYGVVESFYVKQLAQESLRRIREIERIENKVAVVPDAITSAVR
jgi:hypothetical protein